MYVKVLEIGVLIPGKRGPDKEWPDDCQKLEDAFRWHSSLKTGARSNTSVHTGPEGVDDSSSADNVSAPIPAAVASQPHFLVHTLNFECGNLRDASARQIAHILKRSHTLTTINLGRNFLCDPGVKDIADALHTNTSLTTLLLHHNDCITDHAAESLAQAMVCNSSLTSLSLEYNQLSSVGVHLIFESLGVHPSLQTLAMSGMAVSSPNASALAIALSHNTSLRSLDLANACLGAAGAAAIAAALTPPHGNTSLAHLNLASNELTDAGATSFATALLAQPDARPCLDDPSETGGTMITAVPTSPRSPRGPLLVHCGLRSLDLSNNGVTDVGACELGRALAKNHVRVLPACVRGVRARASECLVCVCV